jgi:ABC-type lipoprotein export system ATPase subunit
MNHTIKSGSVSFAKDAADFLTLWDSDNERIANVRNAHMSFIFQENNLLDNISALENAMMPLLIQGESAESAKKIVLNWCMDLDLAFMDEKTKVSELSVGQKQRLAFIRAASPTFTVLFGDEPTGNLDEKNGDVLMEALKSKIKGSNVQMLSIIVSHDIDLAINYADQIVVLTKDTVRKGEIRKENIFSKKDSEWIFNGDEKPTGGIREHIAQLL